MEYECQLQSQFIKSLCLILGVAVDYKYHNESMGIAEGSFVQHVMYFGEMKDYPAICETLKVKTKGIRASMRMNVKGRCNPVLAHATIIVLGVGNLFFFFFSLNHCTGIPILKGELWTGLDEELPSSSEEEEESVPVNDLDRAGTNS